MTEVTKEDVGWQTLPRWRKFHYFVIGNVGPIEGLQRSLCRTHIMDTSKTVQRYWGEITVDTHPPKRNGDECVACVREYEKNYGKDKVQRV